MSKKDYSKLESHVIDVLSRDKSFTYNLEEYKILSVGKHHPNEFNPTDDLAIPDILIP